MDYPLWKNANFALFLNPCLYCRKGLVFQRERHQILFLVVYSIKRNVKKISNFCPKPWTNSFGKMPILWVFETDLFVVQKACLLYKTSKIVFSQFIFTIYHMRLQGVTRSYIGLTGVTGGYKRLQGFTWGNKGLQGVTGGERGDRG